MTTNILIAISAILNGILLSFLFGLLPFLFYLSAIINLFFVWYTKRLLKQSSAHQDDIINMFENLNAFSDHLEKIHSMEMFYGEPVLQDAIDHSRNLINDIVDMQQKYYDIEEEEVLQDDNSTEENETQEE